MAQITTGIRSILNHPRVYNQFLTLIGSDVHKRRLITENVRPFQGMRILDIACGTGSILNHIPMSIEYTGFDISEAYIRRAQARYSERGNFHCTSIDEMRGKVHPDYHVAIAFGVLHHLNDSEAVELFALAAAALLPGGCLIAVDPCFCQGQSRIAQFLIRHDRGQNVRRAEDYASLAQKHFRNVLSRIDHNRLRFPYTHHILTCGAPIATNPRQGVIPADRSAACAERV